MSLEASELTRSCLSQQKTTLSERIPYLGLRPARPARYNFSVRLNNSAFNSPAGHKPRPLELSCLQDRNRGCVCLGPGCLGIKS
jgi:hypothetical protein